jgi:phage shock protein C
VSTQPPSRTRFYKDKANGKLFGVCSGIADYTGIDVVLVRIMFAFSVFLSGGMTLPLYFITALVADNKPIEIRDTDPDQRRFWQGVRASPARSAREIKSRLRSIDRRVADIEHYVTTENRSLAREIDELR